MRKGIFSVFFTVVKNRFQIIFEFFLPILGLIMPDF